MQKFRNNYSSVLSADIDATQTTITVDKVPDGTYGGAFGEYDLPSLSVGEFCYLTIDDGTNIEIVRVTAIVEGDPSHTLTVLRDFTAAEPGAKAFLAGTRVSLNVTAETLAYLTTQAGITEALSAPTVTEVNLNPSADEYLGAYYPDIRQININANFTGWHLHLTIGAYGAVPLLFYRSSTGYDWPTIYFGGVPAVVTGSPGAGSKALLICHRYPSSGYISSQIVALEWLAVT